MANEYSKLFHIFSFDENRNGIFQIGAEVSTYLIPL